MRSIKTFSLSAFLLVAFLSASHAAERFSEEHFCDPKLSNVEIFSCMTDIYDDLEKQRLELEQVRLMSEEELEKEGALKIQELNIKTTSLFEAYREAECTPREAEAFSLSAQGQVACQINLTEQRLDILQPN